jgi:uncharacterized membrane protein
LLTLVILAGVGLRFEGLDRKLLWHDEVYTRIFAAGYQGADWQSALYTGAPLPVSELQRFQRYDPSKTLLDTVAGLAEDEPQHPPLYYGLARLWTGWFGDGIGALRALSAWLSLLTLLGAFWLGRELFDDRRVALVAAALLAVSPFLVLYAQEAREYTLWSAQIVLSCAALLQAMRRMRVWDWALYSALTAITLYTSFSHAAVIIAQVLFIGWQARGRFTCQSLSGVAALSVSAVLFAPWAWILWQHFEAFQASMAWSRTIVIPRAELLGTFALNLSRPTIDLWAAPSSAAALAGVALGVAAFLGGMIYTARRAPKPAVVLLSLLIVVPIGLLLGPDLLWGGIRSISTRYLMPSLLAFQLALAFWVARSGVATTAVLAVGLASCLHNAPQQVVWTKGISADLPRVAALLNAAPAPLVIGNKEAHHPGNMLALSNLLHDGVTFQLVPDLNAPYALPPGPYSHRYLYTPTPPFREALPVPATELINSIYLSVWRLGGG